MSSVTDFIGSNVMFEQDIAIADPLAASVSL